MNKRSQAGVTLMELMIVMVVVGILAAIAYPGYRQQMLRSNRTEAKTTLSQRAQQLERCFTRVHSYAGCVALPETIPSGTYQITGAIDDTTFTLTATPQAAQADDTCGSLALDETNARSATGGTVANCWNR